MYLLRPLFLVLVFLSLLGRPFIPLLAYKIEVSKEVNSESHCQFVQELLKQAQKAKEKTTIPIQNVEHFSIFFSSGFIHLSSEVAIPMKSFKLYRNQLKLFKLTLSLFQPPEMFL